MIPLPDVLPLRPHFREMVWGGRRLAELYGKELPPGKPIGESLELSAYPQRQSVVAAGPLAGRELGSLAAEYGEQLVGAPVRERYGDRFPLLIKLLDAQQDLSIQVHPDDAYARRHGLADVGKMEAWFVLHSDRGRVAHGLHPGVGRAELAAAVAADRVEEVVQFHPVRPGDVVFMPPGTVHALCRGVVIYEVQQSSDVTFRVHDYGRPGLDGQPRQLHVAQAMEAIDFGGRVEPPQAWRKVHGAEADRAVLVECEHFQLNLQVTDGEVVRHAASESFLGLTLVSGQAVVAGQRGTAGDCRHPLHPGDTALVPARREFILEPAAAVTCTYLIASVPV